MAKPYLSIIIPVKNEAERLPLTLLDVDRYLRKAGYAYEIIVVGYGSTDATAEIVEKLKGAIRGLKWIGYEAELGKGGALRRGALLARGTVRLMFSPDYAISIEHFDLLKQEIERGAHAAVGSRFGKKHYFGTLRAVPARLLSHAGALLTRAILPSRVRDVHSEFRAFTAEATQELFERAECRGEAVHAEILALARARGHEVAEVPVRWDAEKRTRMAAGDYLRIFAETLTIRSRLWSGAYGSRHDTSYL